MDDVGSGLCRLSSPLPCSKQHQLQQVSQGHVQSGFEYLYGWRLHNSKQPVPMFSHPHSKKINKFMFKCNFPYFSLCPQLPVLSLGTNKKESGSVIFLSLPPVRYLYTLIRSTNPPRAFFCWGWATRALSASLHMSGSPTHLIVFMALHWTHSDMPMCPDPWESPLIIHLQLVFVPLIATFTTLATFSYNMLQNSRISLYISTAITNSCFQLKMASLFYIATQLAPFTLNYVFHKWINENINLIFNFPWTIFQRYFSLA